MKHRRCRDDPTARFLAIRFRCSLSGKIATACGSRARQASKLVVFFCSAVRRCVLHKRTVIRQAARRCCSQNRSSWMLRIKAVSSRRASPRQSKPPCAGHPQQAPSSRWSSSNGEGSLTKYRVPLPHPGAVRRSSDSSATVGTRCRRIAMTTTADHAVMPERKSESARASRDSPNLTVT
jgi:hypothetical protein